MPETTVTKTTSQSGDREIEQYKTTVPKALAESFGLEGKKLDWEVKSGNKFELTIVKDE
ncbi:hypothetical protein AArcSl_0666 [Halalkaliarchaeum desulfuricum]|uniref:AbrB family transcriptional regulator n=1 Tax=Halalkaliarchaeum desulfuricum TaxID=2055893 RepID=A0A343TGU4_9EURY|nr:hypothetical protein [Halalkaliarchaeum desulfuricum]AUX08316.1 hypothetical protein AArcSl_0666 [Halalkaliarchaeum desulfuricum]